MNPPPAPPPRPRLRTASARGGGGWGDINIHVDINMNINIHTIVNMNRQYWYPQAPLRRPAGLSFFRHALFKKVCFGQTTVNIWTIFAYIC